MIKQEEVIKAPCEVLNYKEISTDHETIKIKHKKRAVFLVFFKKNMFSFVYLSVRIYAL